MSRRDRRRLVAANWKMNGSWAANATWITSFRTAPASCEVVVCAPYVYLAQAVDGMQGTAIAVGAQNINEHESGAHSGEVSAAMLSDIGVIWTIVGHSERRAMYGDTDERVASKVERALAAGLRPIVCVGETLEEREAGRTLEVVFRQFDAVVSRCGVGALVGGAIAYEPVWAIGTGRTARPEQAQEVHAALRARIAGLDPAAANRMRILYGGSVKASNAAQLFGQPDIDGGLIGGASLDAGEFAAICAAAD